MADLKKFVEEVKELSVVELNELVKMIEEEFGVSAAAVAVGAAPAAAEEEPSSVTVHMTAVDAAQKIPTIKVVREITGLGLGEAKALCDNVPSVIKENVAPAEGKEIAEKLKAVGATVELK